jgi:hypothetical protein
MTEQGSDIFEAIECEYLACYGIECVFTPNLIEADRANDVIGDPDIPTAGIGAYEV